MNSVDKGIEMIAAICVFERTVLCSSFSLFLLVGLAVIGPFSPKYGKR